MTVTPPAKGYPRLPSERRSRHEDRGGHDGNLRRGRHIQRVRLAGEGGGRDRRGGGAGEARNSEHLGPVRIPVMLAGCDRSAPSLALMVGSMDVSG